ncbi:glycine zipper 2TM domain-containing protein [Endozoicomonas sp. GU-1]|uniref:glycine zipper 2TM domain-containing protein n=1 Tax=Endozoicomonas sp. GU-1 TaxID=3009078 RepID=UPI0022B55A40|nr:glycine zipper 2TM domain-containing protein [Endozoicomonas sp. GU-1]WBA83213.1 glycine zipper 2TM domain-containing protein [Endozoicomonas sp. GU-1]WBA86138.1 glycine zipper 2TM domain-containing protein [Endozoicomonas sp. GU-1]
MNLRRYWAILPLTFAALLSGCMTDSTGTTYSSSEARRIQQVSFGTVSELQYVTLEGTEGAVGTVAGAAIGGIAGSSVGGGRGSDIAAILGGVAGGVLGSRAEKQLTTQQGIEMTIRLDSGKYISVVQEVDPKVPLQVGDSVKILTQGNTTRVVRMR